MVLPKHFQADLLAKERQCSSDITLLDFFLWEYLQETFYATRSNILEHLELKITIADLQGICWYCSYGDTLKLKCMPLDPKQFNDCNWRDLSQNCKWYLSWYFLHNLSITSALLSCGKRTLKINCHWHKYLILAFVNIIITFILNVINFQLITKTVITKVAIIAIIKSIPNLIDF